MRGQTQGMSGELEIFRPAGTRTGDDNGRLYDHFEDCKLEVITAWLTPIFCSHLLWFPSVCFTSGIAGVYNSTT